MNDKEIHDQNNIQSINVDKATINKLYKSVLNNNGLSLGFLENINKICLDKEKMDELLQKIFEKEFNLKIKLLLYIIIISFNDDFFTDSNLINEENFLKDSFEKCFKLINENNIEQKEIIYFKYSSIIIYCILKLKYNLNYDINLIKNFLEKLQTEDFLKLFDDLYNNIENMKELINKIKTIKIIQKLMNNFSSENQEKKFNISSLSNLNLYITNSNYSNLYSKIKNQTKKNLYYFPQMENLNNIILSLYHKKNTLTKILFFGPISSGKTSYAKEILNEPLIIDVDESIELNYLLGGYLINEFGEIVWQDGILLSALKSGSDILLLGIEKCGNDLLCILKQILENNSIFVLSKQEVFHSFNSKIIMIYNTNDNVNKDIIENNFNEINPLFNFLSSNSFSYFFPKYNFDDIINICTFKFTLCEKEKEILIKLINIYNSIPSKVKINSRFRKITLNNIIYSSSQIHKFFIDNNLLNKQNIFINEKLSMEIICDFFMKIY